MAFAIELIDSNGKTIDDTSCSVGVLGYWSDLASENKLPILKKLYYRSFYEGADIYGDELKLLYNECLILKAIIEKNEPNNSPKKDGIVDKLSKAIGETVGNDNIFARNNDNVIITPNISVLKAFMRFVEIAIEQDGSINIC